MAQNPNIDDDTRARARKFVDDNARDSDVPAAAKAKTATVTKKQLAESGFDNLRDYLNAQKGLTRRGTRAAPAADYSNEGRARVKPAADYSNEGRARVKPAADYSNEGRGRVKPAADYSNEGRGRGKPAALTTEEMLAQIPTGGKPGAGPTPTADGEETSSYRTGSETGDNAANLMMALAMVPGMGPLAGEAAMGRMASRAPAAVDRAKASLPAAAVRAIKNRANFKDAAEAGMKHGGKVAKYAKGGAVTSRGDGLAQRGKTRGTMR